MAVHRQWVRKACPLTTQLEGYSCRGGLQRWWETVWCSMADPTWRMRAVTVRMFGGFWVFIVVFTVRSYSCNARRCAESFAGCGGLNVEGQSGVLLGAPWARQIAVWYLRHGCLVV